MTQQTLINWDLNLTECQRKAYNAMASGKNVLITGQGGVGKSYVIEKYYKKVLKDLGSDRVFKTATTGIAALNIQGRTIHSWAGIMLGAGTTKELLEKMPPAARSRWLRVHILFIDEASMLDPDLFDKLDKIGQHIRGNLLFFGGIQLILSADFLQLSPVSSKFQLYDAKSWFGSGINDTIVLKTNVRQKDPVFQKLLGEIRVGYCSNTSYNILKSRLNVDITKHGIKPTMILSLNKKVDQINSDELNKLLKFGYNGLIDVKAHTYTAKYSVKFNKTMIPDHKLITDFKALSGATVADSITLCIGAQVIIKRNLQDNIVNGTRGIVIDLNMKQVFVRLLDLREIVIDMVVWSYSIGSDFEVNKKQVPFKLGYAISVHGSQSMTLDLVCADLGPSIFAFGQAYVVLSRVRSLEGLSISALDRSRIKANPDIVNKFYPELKDKLEKISLLESLKFSALIVDIIIGYCYYG